MFDLMWKNEELWRTHSSSENIPAPSKDPEISKAALLLWQEHCVECAIPHCYTTCSLYAPRRDQKCRRFTYGIFPNINVNGLFGYGADVFFLRWAKIEAEWYGEPAMVPVEILKGFDGWDKRLVAGANALGNVLEWADPKRRVNGLYTLLRQKWVEKQFSSGASEDSKADGFFIKCFYPGKEEQGLQIEFVQEYPVFRDVATIKPGWNEKFVPYEIMGIRPHLPGRIRLSPTNDQEIRLVFSWLDFVSFESGSPDSSRQYTTSKSSHNTTVPASKVKCVVWDLDNTLWDGVIGEVGPQNVTPNRRAIELIKQLDERGVIHSIASKNTFEVCWPKIEELGLVEYFLYPAIHWGQKSQSLRRIAEELNINLDTFAFIDDSPFERSEVAAACPQVRCYDPSELETVLCKDEFDLPVTPFSQERRKTYLAEAARKRIAASWTGDYDEFLRSCEMVLHIRHPKSEDRLRCLELLQRTNQLNLSGRRFSREELDKILDSGHYQCYALECQDKFGRYGIVGFCAINIATDSPVLTDFVLSCRVAQKKVEETFFYWYASKAQERGASCLRAEFLQTDRNAPLLEVLNKIPFLDVELKDPKGLRILEFSFQGLVHVPNIVKIEIQ